MEKKVEIFFCYAREDDLLLKQLKTHLRPLQRQGFIDVWHDRDIDAGTDWEQEISKHLNVAEIVLLLVSPNFIDSDYCYGVEMKRALERHERGEAHVIPVIMRQSYWQEEPLNKLQALPTDGRPVRSWPDQDEAYFSITEGIRKVVREQYIKWSTGHHDAGNYEDALLMARQVLRLDPRNAQQHKNMGDVLLKLGRNEEALRAFEQAIELNPKYVIAHNAKAWVLNELQRYEEALIVCEETLKLDPNLASAYRNKGRALFELKNYNEALKVYDQAILLDPNNSNVYESKGWLLYLLHRYKEALIAYRQAVKLAPTNATLHAKKGMILRELRQYDEALEALDEAIKLDTNFIEAREEKEAILKNLNHNNKAEEEHKKVQQIKDRVSLIEVTIESVRINTQTDQRVVILKVPDQDYYLFIWIDHSTAYNIAVKLQGTFSPRPLSFDLFQNILDDIGARVTSVIISDLIDEVYYAIVRVKIGGREAEFDARPADALALAIYCYAPIFVEKRVMEIAGVRPDLGTSKD